MHHQEWNQLVDCCECGATISPSTDRAFALDGASFLCFGCAVRRGGIYDDALEHWPKAPDIAGLAGEKTA
jgi:hypothetical protein